jgi:predicted phage tail component-like protein
MANPAYYYGLFPINDNINYYVTDKTFDLAPYTQTLFKIARLEGEKKTGEIVNARKIQLKIKVIGANRVDLEQKLETLYQALSIRQQKLQIYATDDRYYIADCTDATAALAAGFPISTTVTASFTCQQPYAFATSLGTFSTGTVTLTPAAAASTYVFPVQTFNAGTSVYGRPQITIINQNADNSTTLTTGLTGGNVYTTLSVASLPVAVVTGDTFTLSSGTSTQTITTNAPSNAGTTTLTMIPFTAAVSYGVGSTCILDNSWDSISLYQQMDAQLLVIKDASTLPQVSGDRIDVYCDPTVPINGYTIQFNQTGTPQPFNGVFPVVEPFNTSWIITIVANSPPQASVTWTWTPRWLV